MFKARTAGDLLMDAPETQSWKELTTYACNVDYWKSRVRSMRQPRVDVEVTFRPDSTAVRRSRRLAGESAPTTELPALRRTKVRKTEAQKYRSRDEHETFLRPATKEARKKTRVGDVSRKQKG